MIHNIIHIDTSDLEKFIESRTAVMLDVVKGKVQEALDTSQQIVYNLWTDYLAQNGSLDGIDFFDNSHNYIQSIKMKSKNDYSRTVYSDSQGLEKVAIGTNDVEYDMKKTHPYGRKSRVSKKGIPYLIIPFRWGTKKGNRFNNFIPTKLYTTKALKLRKTSKKDSTHYEKNALGQNIERAEYNWGGRLKDVEGMPKGLVRMKTDKSAYFTFRIISAKSKPDSWWYRKQGKPGIDIMGALERTAKPQIDEVVKEIFTN